MTPSRVTPMTPPSPRSLAALGTGGDTSQKTGAGGSCESQGFLRNVTTSTSR